MNWKYVTAAIAQTSTATQTAWGRVRSPRTLFDLGSHEWFETTIATKVDILRQLEADGVLDTVLRACIEQHMHHDVHVLDGLGQAVLACGRAGYRLRLPLLPTLPGHRLAILVAVLARGLEEDRLGGLDNDWLAHELRRLQPVIATWLNRHGDVEQRDRLAS